MRYFHQGVIFRPLWETGESIGTAHRKYAAAFHSSALIHEFRCGFDGITMKVYISSTYRDLQKYRSAVATVLRRMGHQPIGMEDYVAEGVKPLHRCLADVAACDAYVGIIAWRYGSVPTDAGVKTLSLPNGTSLGITSITEFEFRHAIQSGKHVLVFLLDADAEWPSSQFDAVSGDGAQGKSIS